MIASYLHDLGQLWPAALTGAAWMLAGSLLGWGLSHRARNPMVRLVRWWIERLVVQHVLSAGFTRRALTIFANNTLVCAVVVLGGRFVATALAAVAAVGLGLGIALSLLTKTADDTFEWMAPQDKQLQHRVTVGIALNLFELPAIVLAVGLSLGQDTIGRSLSPGRAATLFLVLAMPLLLIAATGESMWIGAGIRKTSQADQDRDANAHVR